jgi:hypothetical protein
MQTACNSEARESNDQDGRIEMTIEEQNIRHAALAGQWYQANPEELRQSVRNFIDHAWRREGLKDIVGIIAPHAGHVYSGPVAGHAYRQIQGNDYDVVIVIAPNHVDPTLNFTSVYTKGAYETPLGMIPVDTETAEAIVNYASSDAVKSSEVGHLTVSRGRMEHSLEIQLPFLQVALEEFKLVPVVMGNHNTGGCKSLADAIANAVEGKKALLVGSSDLSHFHSQSEAEDLDGIVAEHVSSYDPQGLLDVLASGKAEACGGAPMAAVMMAANKLGATNATVLNMATSGDITGDTSNVVGYMSAAIHSGEDNGSSRQNTEDENVGVNLGLTDDEKDRLRSVVSETLETVVNGGSVPDFRPGEGNLNKEWGAFVTLNKNGRLRGCIGHIVGTQPLIQTVADMTRAAALQDYRFPPVKPEELGDIEFEISVLTPIREVEDISAIQVGRDGLIISRGANRGLLLPQVATEYGWDRETFLAHTCQKAGLPMDAWKQEGTKIEMFSADVFH